MSSTKSTLSSLTELVVPILSILFALYYLSTIRGIPFLAQMYGGGISIFLLLLSVALSVRIILKTVASRSEAEGISISQIKNAGRFYSKAIALVLAMAVYIGLMSTVGYPLMSFLFVAVTTYILGVKRISRTALIALAVTVTGYLLFIVFLQVRLPTGPLRYLGL